MEDLRYGVKRPPPSDADALHREAAESPAPPRVGTSAGTTMSSKEAPPKGSIEDAAEAERLRRHQAARNTPKPVPLAAAPRVQTPLEGIGTGIAEAAAAGANVASSASSTTPLAEHAQVELGWCSNPIHQTVAGTIGAGVVPMGAFSSLAVEEFIKENGLDATVAKQLRDSSIEVQNDVVGQGDLRNCRSPSAVAYCRIRDCKRARSEAPSQLKQAGVGDMLHAGIGCAGAMPFMMPFNPMHMAGANPMMMMAMQNPMMMMAQQQQMAMAMMAHQQQQMFAAQMAGAVGCPGMFGVGGADASGAFGAAAGMPCSGGYALGMPTMPATMGGAMGAGSVSPGMAAMPCMPGFAAMPGMMGGSMGSGAFGPMGGTGGF